MSTEDLPEHDPGFMIVDLKQLEINQLIIFARLL